MWHSGSRVLGLFVVHSLFLHGIWGLSSPTRDQTSSPTLQGRFLTTGPPGKSPKCILHGRTWSISLTVIAWPSRLDFLIKCVFYCGGDICERALDKLLRRQKGRWEYQRAQFILWLSLALFGSPEETKILHRASFSSCNGQNFYSYRSLEV